jgi:hypothetical protein
MDEDDWHGSAVRSALDNRVWFAVLPGTDIMTSEGHCSTSVRRVKAYVLEQAAHGADVAPETLRWERDGEDEWVLTDR